MTTFGSDDFRLLILVLIRTLFLLPLLAFGHFCLMAGSPQSLSERVESFAAGLELSSDNFQVAWVDLDSGFMALRLTKDSSASESFLFSNEGHLIAKTIAAFSRFGWFGLSGGIAVVVLFACVLNRYRFRFRTKRLFGKCASFLIVVSTLISCVVIYKLSLFDMPIPMMATYCLCWGWFMATLAMDGKDG